MFESLALVGGFGFFLFMLAVLVVGIVSAEFDSIFGGIITLLFFSIGAQIIFDYPILSTVLANPLWIFIGVVGYTVVGMLYAVYIKYVRFLKKYESEIVAEWKVYKDLNPERTHDDFLGSSAYRPYTPKRNIDKITAWVVLWPWAVIWDLSHRPFIFIYDNVYSITGRMLDAAGKRVTKKMLEK